MDDTLKDLVEKCEKLGSTGKRNITETSCELIFSGKERTHLNEFFSDVFGPAIKPAGRKPAAYEKCITGNYGGITAYQKLFIKKTGDFTVIAIFRPWRFDTHITVTLALIANSEIEKNMRSPVFAFNKLLDHVISKFKKGFL